MTMSRMISTLLSPFPQHHQRPPSSSTTAPSSSSSSTLSTSSSTSKSPSSHHRHQNHHRRRHHHAIISTPLSSTTSTTRSTTVPPPPPLLLLLLLVLSSQLSPSASSTEDDGKLSFSLEAVKTTAYAVEKPPKKSAASGGAAAPVPINVKLIWKLDFGEFTKDDFVYTISHKYRRASGGEGMNIVSSEYPSECIPSAKYGPVECGMRKSLFEGRIHMQMLTYTHDNGYDALIVNILNVTSNDFNVDPDRVSGDVVEKKMKFEATMHCAVRERIGDKSSSTIEVVYTKDDPNRAADRRNEEKENYNYATVGIAITVVVVVILVALILFAKRKSIKACLTPGGSGEKKTKDSSAEVEEAVKTASNGESEKLAQHHEV